jgi:putative membrane protein
MQHHALPETHGTALSDSLPLLLVAAVAALYLYGAAGVRGKKGGWGLWRTFSFLVGTALLGVSLLPSTMRWAHQDLRGHMVQHLLLGMFAPLFLVLGAPVTLALKALPVGTARVGTAVLRSSLFYSLSHPLPAFLLNIGGMYLLYLTPLYTESLKSPFLHAVVHLHFLLAGYLFTWSMIGQEPVPRRPAFNVRVFMLFVSIASHAFLSKFMYAYLYPINSPHSAGQIQEAAKLMYYWGDLSELLLAIALFAAWYKKRESADLLLPKSE